MKRRLLRDIAQGIDDHLKRMENDPDINTIIHGMHGFYHPGAYSSSAGVHIKYVVFQGDTRITREQAEAYLAWLNAGNNGTHWSAERSKKEEAKP